MGRSPLVGRVAVKSKPSTKSYPPSGAGTAVFPEREAATLSPQAKGSTRKRRGLEVNAPSEDRIYSLRLEPSQNPTRARMPTQSTDAKPEDKPFKEKKKHKKRKERESRTPGRAQRECKKDPCPGGLGRSGLRAARVSVDDNSIYVVHLL